MVGKSELLNAADTQKFRSVIARANYLAPDRHDIGFGVKELVRRMHSPDKNDRIRLQ